jgi:serine/threonine-protein kinase
MMSSELVGTRIRNYEVVEQIARGGMATIYKARDVLHDQVVALKVLPPELGFSDEFLSRFQREVETLKHLRHPNIVQLYDVGRTENLRYFCMEYVPGGSVEQLVNRRGKLETNQAIDIAMQVTEALRYAHQRGVIHRDIKPANLLLEESGRTKVTDFGIAKVADATQMTLTGGIVGTVEYLAPEQVEGRRVGPRTDVYSLGVSLYQMVTGRLPFIGSTPTEILQKHRFNLPESPRELNPEVPQRLSELIEQMLQKEPDRRPESMQVVKRELERIKVQMALAPEADKQPLRVEKRRLWPLVLAAVLLVGAGVLGYWLSSRKSLSEPSGTRATRTLWDMDNEAYQIYYRAKKNYEGALKLIDKGRVASARTRLQIARHLLALVAECLPQTRWVDQTKQTGGYPPTLLEKIEKLEAKLLPADEQSVETEAPTSAPEEKGDPSVSPGSEGSG